MTYYAVDRIEGTVAVVIAEDGERFDVPKKNLPKGTREGTVLRLDGAGGLDWSRCVIDEAERERRVKAARQRLERLGRSDEGGDITL